MRISPVNNNYNFNRSKSLNFRSLSCDYKLPDGQEMGMFTWFYRKDLPWERFTEYVLDNFKNKENVNVIQFAPSDGSESYTLILSLLKNMELGINKSDIEKFFPIKAYDLNPKLVKGANLGYINLRYSDVSQMVKRQINPNRYFEGALDMYLNNKSFRRLSGEDVLFMVPFKIDDDLRKKVRFNYGDMFEKVKDIKDDSNTIVMARNSLAYFSEEKVKGFIDNLANTLKSDSIFVYGLLEEEEPYLASYLNRSGFERVMRNVFKRS